MNRARVRQLLTFDRGPLRSLKAEAKRKKIPLTELVRQIIEAHQILGKGAAK